MPWRFTNLVKRAFDILVSALALLVLTPVFAVIGLIIKRDSPGPVFYRGPRYGMGGRIFKILKFRTMREDHASYTGPRLTAQDDPRVTPLGRWLRDTKLNELPQFWNVLVGDMSLVGPRPEDPDLAVSWPLSVRNEILSVRPGITSPASVLYHNEEALLRKESLMDTYLGSILPTKLRLDQLYIRHRSFLLDLDVLFWTFMVLVPRIGSTAPPEERLFLGPVSKFIQRYVSWFVLDLMVTFAAIVGSGLLFRTMGPLELGVPKAILLALGFAWLYSLTGALMGVNRISWSQASAIDALDLVPAVTVATAAALLVNRLWLTDSLIPPAMILLASGLSFFGYVTLRYRARLVSGFATRWIALRGAALEAQERVLIVGGGEAGQFVAWWLKNGSGVAAFHPIGFVDDDLYKLGTRIQGFEVLGRTEDIPRLVEEHDAGIIIFAIHNIVSAEKRHILELCRATPARVMMFPDILGSLQAVASGNTNEPRRPEAEVRTLHPEQVLGWLTDLERLSDQGDLAGLRQRLAGLRANVQAAASEVPAARPEPAGRAKLNRDAEPRANPAAAAAPAEKAA
jgi:lipopolysaccharide/colanic/teichoic acid biosynthesis glycosyltransferase